MTVAIKFENISKLYRLGEVGTGTLAHDLHRAWAKLRGKPDPFAKVGQLNDRTQSSSSSSRQNVDSSYVWALKDINFEVQQGEILGIIGRNGAGKSTLLKLLSRVTAPTTGSIKSRGRIASLLEVGTGFHPELTGRENIYLNGAILGMRRHEITKRLEEIVEFSGCAKYIDTPVKRYSSGMMVRLGFAVAAHLDCEILVVDEVLAVGDSDFQKKCVGRMQQISSTSGKSVLFVSHAMSSVRKLCSRGLVIERGTVAFDGLTEEAVNRYCQTSGAVNSPVVDLRENMQDRFGSRNFSELLSIRVEGSYGPANDFTMGESVTFTIDYQVKEPCEELELGIIIANMHGIAVHQFVSFWEGLTIGATCGPHQVAIRVPNIGLFPGTYQVHLWTAKKSNYYDDAKHEALLINISEPLHGETQTYFSRYSQNTQVYVTNHWNLRSLL